MVTQKIYEALNWASSYLEKHGREAHAGELLMKHTLQVSRASMLARLREPLTDEQLKQFAAAIEQHALGVPVQHIIGFEEFYGRLFAVNGQVLIPRPETEELVYHALEKIKEKRNPVIADIGTGSGAIAVTMKAERPDAAVHAVDISEAALATAKQNAKKLQAKVMFWHGDLLAPLIEQNIQVDLLLSNPPYIPAKEQAVLSPVVVDHEPHLALFGGEDGLDLYRKMALQMPLVLKSGAIAGVETGAGQTGQVAELFQQAFPAGRIDILHDINGKDRMVFLHL